MAWGHLPKGHALLAPDDFRFWRRSPDAVPREHGQGKPRMLLLLGFITQLYKKADFSSPGTRREARSVTKTATALPQGISILEWQIPKPSLLHGTHHAQAVQLIHTDQCSFEPLCAINICILWWCCAMFGPKHKIKMKWGRKSETKYSL